MLRINIRKQNRALWLPLVLGSLALLLWAACSSRAEPDRTARKIPVKTAPVTHRKVVVPVQTSGMLAAQAEMRLSFKIGGIVSRLAVEEGAKVRPGQLLASLDPAEIRAQVTQARRALEKAERDLQRVKNLYADQVATLEQLQNVTTARDVAAAQLEIAEFNLRHSKIYAPSSGRILKRFVERNELVSAGTPIFSFGATGHGWVVRVGVSERELVRLQWGDSARVRFDAYPGQDFRARVCEMAEALDPRSGTFEVELALDPSGWRLASGFVAAVEIYPATPDTFAVIPIEAVVEADGFAGVIFTPEVAETGGAIARRVPVSIAHISGEFVAVRRGLENVQTVITDGAAYLVDGTPVAVIDAE